MSTRSSPESVPPILHRKGGGRSPEENPVSAAPLKHRSFLTVENIADDAQVSPRTVRRWIAKKELKVHRLGAAVRIHQNDWEDFLAKRREG